MSIRLTRPCVYADLGEVWLGDQLARLAQRQAQFGGHYRADADALLHRLARTARVAKTMATPAAARASAMEHALSATVEVAVHVQLQNGDCSHATRITAAA